MMLMHVWQVPADICGLRAFFTLEGNIYITVITRRYYSKHRETNSDSEFKFKIHELLFIALIKLFTIV